MATDLKLPAAFSEAIITAAEEMSAATALVNVIPVSTKRDLVTHTFSAGDASFHNGDGTDKTVSDDELQAVEIFMSTLYKLLEFPDWQAEDAEETVKQIEAALPQVISKTLDKLVGGGSVTGARFGGYTETPAVVDATAASWEAVFEALSANGHTPTGAILNTSFKGLIKQATTEGTNINPLNVNVSDGFQLGGIPVYFRDLGDTIGVIGDFDKAILAISGDIDSEFHTPSENYELRKKNMAALYAGLRVGYGIADQTAFVPVAVA